MITPKNALPRHMTLDGILMNLESVPMVPNSIIVNSRFSFALLSLFS
jgi:hypothetical protein